MDLTSKQRKKIVKYILDDRSKKLSKFAKKEEIALNSIMNSKGEKMVHICCREGAVDCLEYLVKAGARVNLVDKKGNLPIHNALEYCMENYSRELESDLVSFLLTYSTNLLNMQNFKGVCPKDLLGQLEDMKARSRKQSSTTNPSYDLSSDAESDQEKNWEQKLRDECDYEYNNFMGKYEQDSNFLFAEPEPDTFDAWADKIYASFSERRRRMYAPPPTSTCKSKSNSESTSCSTKEAPKKKLAPEHDITQMKINTEKIREARKLKKIREQCKKIWEIEEGETITLEDIPYRGMVAGDILDAMLKDCEGEDEIKRKIRDEVRRWHPDKFRQKVGSRLVQEKADVIMEEVKRIAQAIISYAK